MTDVVRVDGRFETEPFKVVYKYAVEIDPDPVVVGIPRGARLLHVEFVQREAVVWDGSYFYLWYEVDLSEKDNLIDRVYQVMATGIPIPKTVKHLATGITRDYSFVVPQPRDIWHLYEWPSGAKVVHV